MTPERPIYLIICTPFDVATSERLCHAGFSNAEIVAIGRLVETGVTIERAEAQVRQSKGRKGYMFVSLPRLKKSSGG